MAQDFDRQQIESLRKSKEDWERESYARGREREVEFVTSSGVPIAPLYTPADLPHLNYVEDLGFPGREPFTRGAYPTMYRGQLWTRRQLAGFGTPEDTNHRLRYLLDQGATGVNLVFDYPSLRGWNSDDWEAEADAGKGGVAVDSLEDMETLFQGIPIDEVSVSLVTCNPSAAVVLMAMYFAAARKQEVDLARLAGTSQNDFLMETAITAAPPALSPTHSFKLSCDLIEFCTHHTPRWNPISYTGYNYREAGATAIQELAFVLSNAIATVEELTARGLEVDEFAPRLSFFLAAHSDFFEEVAKCRAARRLWQRIVKERFGAKNPQSGVFRFHVQTGGVTLTAQQPLINIVRAAYQGLAAALGGAQSVHIDAYDEALCTPTELSSLIALRSQQIIQYETNVASTIDPLGGSYYVESLTNEIEERVRALIAKIDELGGIVAATEKGWVHSELSHSAHQHQKRVESGELLVVGVNCFTTEEEIPVETFTSPQTVERQRAKLERLRAQRDDGLLAQRLDEVRSRCRNRENVMGAVLGAAEAGATLREVSNIFREEFGEWNIPLMH